jgi:hypothetical protein
MAKKKTASSESHTAKPAAAKREPAKKEPAKKAGGAGAVKAAKPAKPHAPPSAMPMVDTSLAAQAAARMLFSKRPGSQSTDDKKESSLVKQIKSDLNKPHASAVSNVLNKSAPAGSPKPSNLPFDQKQVGRNQTYSPDVTRTGVPRRTSSG